MGKQFKDLRIVFMGTPEFAVASLDALIQAGGNIVGVITAPDKPAGRGMELKGSAVKQYAQSKGLPLLQPDKLKDPVFLEALQKWEADVQVVVAFRMLPEVVWNMPPLGTINVHGSLLPKYRGAAPINWAIINGESVTGVTTFKLQHEIDTGNILLSASVPIPDTSNVGDIHDQLKEAGAKIIVETLQQLAAGTLTPQPQDNLDPATLPHAPKLTTDTARIAWNQPTVQVYNLIRGLSPYPAAFTQLHGKTLKIFASTKASGTSTDSSPAGLPAPGTASHDASQAPESATGVPPGTALSDGKTYLKFATADGFLLVTDLQLEGKKRMKTEDFLRGYRWPV
jgi:methionyl-tRNA formyltransferase